MKAELSSSARAKTGVGAHLFEGVDISGIYDDHAATAGPSLVRDTPLSPVELKPAAVGEANAPPHRRAARTRRSQSLEKAWIYTALIAAFAMVIGISVG